MVKNLPKWNGERRWEKKIYTYRRCCCPIKWANQRLRCMYAHGARQVVTIHSICVFSLKLQHLIAAAHNRSIQQNLRPNDLWLSKTKGRTNDNIFLSHIFLLLKIISTDQKKKYFGFPVTLNLENNFNFIASKKG